MAAVLATGEPRNGGGGDGGGGASSPWLCPFPPGSLLHLCGDLLPTTGSSTTMMVCGGVAVEVVVAVWRSRWGLLFLIGEICGGGMAVGPIGSGGSQQWARPVVFLVFLFFFKTLCQELNITYGTPFS